MELQSLWVSRQPLPQTTRFVCGDGKSPDELCIIVPNKSFVLLARKSQSMNECGLQPLRSTQETLKNVTRITFGERPSDDRRYIRPNVNFSLGNTSLIGMR